MNIVLVMLGIAAAFGAAVYRSWRPAARAVRVETRRSEHPYRAGRRS